MEGVPQKGKQNFPCTQKSVLNRGSGFDKLRADLVFAIGYGLGQRVSVTRHPFAGTARGRPRRLSLSKPAGLETDQAAHGEGDPPWYSPTYARNGRWIANKSSLCSTPSVVVFPPELPVATVSPPERPGAVQGAPAFGAA